ncbi:MAG: MFS transporter [Thermoflexales bacterium]|nr:MFS transporter [Thermoflexales bacterium]
MTQLLTLKRNSALHHTLGYYSLLIYLGLGTGLTGPTLPSLASQTHTRIGDMGLVFLVGAIGYALGTGISGRIFDRARGHPVLGLAQLASAALILLIPFIPWLWLLLAVLACKGFADGFSNTGTNTLLTWTYKEKVGPYMNGLHFCFGLGAFLSPFLVAQVITLEGGYRWGYWVLGVLGLLAGAHMLTLGESPQPVHASEGASRDSRGNGRVNYPLVLVAALFLFFYVGAEITFGGWVYTYAVTLQLADAVSAAYLSSAFWLSFTIGRLISIPAATRFTPRQIVPAALAACLAILTLLAAMPSSGLLLWVAAVGLGFCMAPVWPSGFTLAGQSLHLTARTSGLILLGDSFGGMILPWLVGLVIETSGPHVMVYLILASIVGNLLAFVGILRLRRNI